jgi:hypothetical protein
MNSIYIRLLYILISSIILFTICQLIRYKKDDPNPQTVRNKVVTYIICTIVCVGIIFYFNIGVDEIKYGGEIKLNNVIQFEKSMIRNIKQDVDVGISAPF